MQQLQQKDWCEQQIKELDQKKTHEKKVESLYDAQTLHMNAQLRDMQSDHNRKRYENEMDAQRVNQIMHQEKLNRDKEMHADW